VRSIASIFLLGRVVLQGAADENVHDPLMVKALTGLEKHLEARFEIPFPANFDPASYLKPPLAVIPVEDGKVCANRPILNPYDEPLLVEWMIGPADPLMLGKNELSCRLDFNLRSDFEGIGLVVDWASDETGNHSLERREGESGHDFFRRGVETYRFRSRKAQKPVQAELFLKAFGKISLAIRALRGENAELGTK
jgi:hypothetical protein